MLLLFLGFFVVDVAVAVNVAVAVAGSDIVASVVSVLVCAWVGRNKMCPRTTTITTTATCHFLRVHGSNSLHEILDVNKFETCESPDRYTL